MRSRRVHAPKGSFWITPSLFNESRCKVLEVLHWQNTLSEAALDGLAGHFNLPKPYYARALGTMERVHFSKKIEVGVYLAFFDARL